MFQFPECPALRLYIQRALWPLAEPGVTPFGFDRLVARLQLPDHVSPLSASFIGRVPLGIPPTPFSLGDSYTAMSP
jgi:hypothetical protein